MLAVGVTRTLQVMDLHGIAALNDQDLASVAAGFPRLVYVDLSFCKVRYYRCVVRPGNAVC